MLHRSLDAADEARLLLPDISAGGAAGQLGMLRRLLRDCAEELGSLGNIRRKRNAEIWSQTTELLEHRMLAALDAVVALGLPFESGQKGEGIRLEALAELVAYGRSWRCARG